MLNKALASKIIKPEMRLLYDLKLRLSSTDIRVELKETVRSIRKKYQSKSVDQLQRKADTYGNNGGWAENLLYQLAAHTRR